jgi:excisionase family DNA binding protein
MGTGLDGRLPYGASGMKGIRIEPAITNEILMPKDVADILGLTLSTVYKYAKSGRFKAYRKYGEKHFYFMRKDIEELKANEGFELFVPDDAPTGKELGLKRFKGKSLTTKDVARLMCVSERWVQEKMEDNTFPVRWFLIGERNRLIDSADLDNFLSIIEMKPGNAELPLKAVKKILSKEVAVK